MKKNLLSITMATLLFSASALSAHASDIVRHKSANAASPIAAGVEVPPNLTTFYLSGHVPPVVNTGVANTSIEAYGDTKTQTIGVLKQIKTTLNGMNLDFKDVVKVQVFLVADPKLGKMDFAGFSEGYAEFFGGPQPTLAARSTMAIAGLVNPGWLVEIEVTVAKKK